MKLKTFDYIISFIVLLVTLFYIIDTLKNPGGSSQFYIESNGNKHLYQKKSKETITLKGPIGETTIEINSGIAKITKSDCKDQICVQMGNVFKHGQIAACLPNKIILGIEEDDNETDVITY